MRKRKLDNIEKDSAAALRLGYGARYGHYKADHPHTKEQETQPPAKPMGVCRYCKKLFPFRPGKLYCDDDCRQAYNSENRYSKSGEDPRAIRPDIKPMEVGDYLTCAECGSLFKPVRKGNIFCSPACCNRRQNRERYRQKHGFYKEEG